MAYILAFDFSGRAPRLKFEWEDEPKDRHIFGLTAKVPVDISRLPTTAILKDHRNKNKNGPDQFPDIMSGTGWASVSQRFKDLVERFEPGVHLFHPITLKRPNGTVIKPNYYIFSANQHADFVLTKMMELKWYFYSAEGEQEPLPESPYPNWTYENHGSDSARQPPGFSLSFASMDYHQRVNKKKCLFISKIAVDGWHLYTSWRGDIARLYVSDEFYKAFKKERLQYLQAQCYANEVDELWYEEENFGPALEWIRTHDTNVSWFQEWQPLPNNGRGK